MATTISLQNLIILSTIFTFLNIAASSDNEKYHKILDPKQLGPRKLTHLHFYFHDDITGQNPTVVQLAGPKPSLNSSTFGLLMMMDDPLTVGPERTSKRIGSSQGMYGSSSQSTEMQLLMVLNYVFTDGKFNGSTLSVLGNNAVFREVREMPIVGGTGVFRFATGYAQARTYSANATSFNAVVEYNVYAFHY